MDIIQRNNEIANYPTIWASEYFKTFNITPNGLQRDILTADKDEHYVQFICARQEGATTGIIMGALFNALISPKKHIVIMSPHKASLDYTKGKCLEYIINKPGTLDGVQTIQHASNVVLFRNGSSIRFVNGKSQNSTRGLRADIVYIDNSSFIDSEAITTARILVTENNGQVISIR